MVLGVGQTLTLDGGGDQNSVFVFQIGSALTLGNGSTIHLQNGANARNIVWACVAAATVGTTAVVSGDIIAGTTVALHTGATLFGRAISLTAAVTLDDNAIHAPEAGPGPGPSPSPTNPSNTASIVLSEVCFPDITGKTIRSWGLVTFISGGYTTGGLNMGLYNFLDVRTVDFNGFLKCDVWGEEPTGAALYEYHYSPVGDVLQIFNANGTELSSGVAIPTAVLVDIVLFEATVDRTSVRG
jgi:hypothetical protein